MGGELHNSMMKSNAGIPVCFLSIGIGTTESIVGKGQAGSQETHETQVISH
jgi:hypothetical protein